MKELCIEKTTLDIGLGKELKFLHLTDTHIVRDTEKENGRAAVFETTDEEIEYLFFKAVEYAKENNLFIVHTGDLVDYITNANLKFLDENLKDVDYILAPGSHDFCHLIPGHKEYFDWKAAGFSENDEYKSEQIKNIAPHIKNNMYFASKTVDGVNFVALDNSYLNITEGQLDSLKAEVAKGLPIVVGMHIPMHTKALQEVGLMPRENLCSTEKEQKEHAEKVGRPDLGENIRTYSQSTWDAIEYMKTEPLIKVVLAGHRHRNFEEALGKGKYQIVTHANCHAFAREIILV